MSKKDKSLIVVTILLVIVLIFGFVYDRKTALIARTTPFDIESGAIVAIEKQGMLFYRRGYQAKIQINQNLADYFVLQLADYYGYGGYVISGQEYLEELYEDMKNEAIYPVPLYDSSVWIQSMNDPNEPDVQLTYIIDYELGDKMYMYIYFNR